MSSFYYVGPAESKEEALKRLAEYHPYIAVDTETVSLEDRTCIGVGIATSPTEAYYFPTYMGPKPYAPPTENMNELVAKLEHRGTFKDFFNVNFDLTVLEESHGISAEPYRDLSPAFQVQGMHNDLALLVGMLLGQNHTEIKDILPKGKNMLDLSVEKTAFKCINDCLRTFQLRDMIKLEQWCKGEPIIWTDVLGQKHDVNLRMQDCYDVDMRLIPILRKMAKRGIALRPDALEEWLFRVSDQCREYEKIFEGYGVNIRSNPQVGTLLANRGHVLPMTKTWQLQVDEDALKACDPDPLIDIIIGKGEQYDPERMIGYREYDKLRTTYIFPLLTEDRFYTHFRIDLATGRLASYDRNVQNIPPQIREVFAPDSGIWTWFDYSQIEMRVFAYRSQDPTMVNAYKSGEDIHWITQQALFPGVPKEHKQTRTRSKTYNFAMVFDAVDFTLAKNTGLSVSEAGVFRRRWFNRYDRAESYMEAQGDFIIEHGWCETEFGRRMVAPDYIRGVKHVRTCGINYPVQGTAADIIKRAMLLCALWGLDFPVQVHDEVLVDGECYEFLVNDGSRLLSSIHPEIYTPIEVEKGTHWS